jgi:hypothetical protein
MRENYNRNNNNNNNREPRNRPVEDTEPVDGFRLESDSDDNTGNGDAEIDNAKCINVDSKGRILINGPVTLHIHGSDTEGRSPDVVGNTLKGTGICEKCSCETPEQNGLNHSDTSGSSTPTSDGSPPIVCRPKERKGVTPRRPSGGSPGLRTMNGNSRRDQYRPVSWDHSPDSSPPWNHSSKQRGRHNSRNELWLQGQPGPRQAGTFNRQDSNTSVGSCEFVLPGPLHNRGSLTDTDSDVSSLNSGDLGQLVEKLKLHSTPIPSCTRCGKNCPRPGQCKRKSDPTLDARPVPIQTQTSENGTAGTRERNNSQADINGKNCLVVRSNLQGGRHTWLHVVFSFFGLRMFPRLLG